MRRIIICMACLVFIYLIGQEQYNTYSPASGSLILDASASIGLLLTLVFFLAAFLVFFKPILSAFFFLFGGFLGLLASATGFTEINLWGFSFILAIISFFESRHVWYARRSEQQEPVPERRFFHFF